MAACVIGIVLIRTFWFRGLLEFLEMFGCPAMVFYHVFFVADLISLPFHRDEWPVCGFVLSFSLDARSGFLGALSCLVCSELL